MTVNSTNSCLSIGWALKKGRTGRVRFSENVRRYLTTKFEMGERTGKKANPEKIARKMNDARNEWNERLFQREEWLHASLHGRALVLRMLLQGNRCDITADENDDIDALSNRNNLLDNIQSRIGLEHPIVYDT